VCVASVYLLRALRSRIVRQRYACTQEHTPTSTRTRIKPQERRAAAAAAELEAMAAGGADSGAARVPTGPSSSKGAPGGKEQGGGEAAESAAHRCVGGGCVCMPTFVHVRTCARKHIPGACVKACFFF